MSANMIEIYIQIAFDKIVNTQEWLEVVIYGWGMKFLAIFTYNLGFLLHFKLFN